MTQEELRKLVTYRKKDGALIWKRRAGDDRITKTFNTRFAGKVVGSVTANGYLETAITQKRFLVHRLVFLYHRGYLPEFVDHRNGNTVDNRISNLREATRAQNMQNTTVKVNNRSGSSVKGVSQYGKHGKWRVQIMANRVLYTKASFDSMEEAEKYAKELMIKLHKEFVRTE